MSITFLQSASKEAGTVTSTTLAFASNVTVGSLKTCLIRTGTGSGVTNSASDNLDGSYSQDAFQAGAPNANVSPSINSKANASAGATTVTATQSGSASLRLVIQEVGGIATSSPLDVTANANAASGTALASGAVTTTTANQFLCGFLCGNNGTASGISVGTGWTQDQQILSNADRLLSEYQIVSATGSYNATGSMTVSDAWSAFIATYKGAAASTAPFTPVDINAGTKARWAGSDFTPANLLAQQTLRLPPFTQEELPGWAIRAKGNYTDFAPPNLLADQVLKLPPFTQRELPGVMLPARGITDFIHPNLIESTLLPAPRPLTPVDLSQQVKAKWSTTDFAPVNLLTPQTLKLPPFTLQELPGWNLRARALGTDFTAPNLLSLTLTVPGAPVLAIDLSQQVKSRWTGSDFNPGNLLLGILPAPPIAPVDAMISIRAKGVFTDFSPPNLTLSTLVPPAALHPLDTSLRLEYRWIRGDDLPLNLLPLKLQTVNPIAPQDLSGMRLDAPALRSDFVPPNLTLTLPVPPPPPVSTAAGRHGTRRQARRRRELDVLRARIEAFKEQRADADRALIAAEDREVKARSQILKRVRVRTQELRKPLEQYAPVKKAVAQRAVATDRYRSILGQIRAHQLEADRIQREIESEAADEQAALHLMHYLMMEIPWDE